ncbi:MAG: cytochrome P450 [Solirubrobacteraceae bacterium]
MAISDEPRNEQPAGAAEDVLVTDEEHWTAGPPHALFARLREECPVHWTSRIEQEPGESGYWSVLRPEDIRTVSRDWRTFSSERGGVTLMTDVFPLELMQAMFIGMDPPRHDRLKQLFQAGFTPRRIAAHEPAIRRIVVDVLASLAQRAQADLVTEVAQPIVSRVIGSFMGVGPDEDAGWARLMNGALSIADPDINPDGPEALREQMLPEIFRRCQALIAARRERPTDDLTSVLVHAEIDGERLTEPEIVMGFFLLMAAGNDSTKATYCSAMRALMADGGQCAALIEDPALIPAAVEEALRMFPAFAHFRRTATCDTELGGRRISEGDKVVMWYAASGRDPARYPDPDRFDVHRHPEHQAFGAGGRHFCLGAALARLELTVMLQETLARYPEMAPAGPESWVQSAFLNQLKTLPVALGSRRGD